MSYRLVPEIIDDTAFDSMDVIKFFKSKKEFYSAALICYKYNIIFFFSAMEYVICYVHFLSD